MANPNHPHPAMAPAHKPNRGTDAIPAQEPALDRHPPQHLVGSAHGMLESPHSRHSRWAVLLLITALHGAGLGWIYALSARQPAMQPVSAPPMVMAQLLPQPKLQPAVETPPSLPLPKPAPLPKPVPLPKQRLQRPPKATRAPKTAPSERALTTPKQQEQTAAADAPVDKTAPLAAAPPSLPTPAPPAAVVAPRFDAAYLNNPPPSYPPVLRRLGEVGKVMLRVHVTVEGSAGEVRIQNSSGSSLFDEAALHAVRQWRFIPARQGDTAVAAWVQVPIIFQLN
ncbi:MAG: energy transducer TonB [Glaciimonas sp.]|nr:energy transducer TonB [Glaciimonas sp.]